MLSMRKRCLQKDGRVLDQGRRSSGHSLTGGYICIQKERCGVWQLQTVSPSSMRCRQKVPAGQSLPQQGKTWLRDGWALHTPALARRHGSSGGGHSKLAAPGRSCL